MKPLVRLLSILVIFFYVSSFVSSCDDDDDPAPNPNVTFTATLSGANEVPPNNSTAVGSATLTFNTVTKVFVISVTHNVVSPTAGHVHKGAVGVNGDPVFPFANATSPITYTSAPLTASMEADLNAHLYYVNIHSAAFPGGEIRGQLVK